MEKTMMIERRVLGSLIERMGMAAEEAVVGVEERNGDGVCGGGDGVEFCIARYSESVVDGGRSDDIEDDPLVSRGSQVHLI